MDNNYIQNQPLIKVNSNDSLMERDKCNHLTTSINTKSEEAEYNSPNIEAPSSPYLNAFGNNSSFSKEQYSFKKDNDFELKDIRNMRHTRIESNSCTCVNVDSLESEIGLDTNEIPTANLSNQSLVPINGPAPTPSPTPAALPVENERRPTQNIYCSPATESRISIGQICRICHEDDTLEKFISPCGCTGSLALVHKTCMEKWLSNYSHHEKCELCNCAVIVVRKPKSIREYVMEANSGEIRTAIVSDFFCLLILTPIIFWSSFICIKGVSDYFPGGIFYNQTMFLASDAMGNKQIKYEKMESELSKTAGVIAGLIAVSIVLMVVYFGWLIVAIRFHIKTWMDWRKKNHRIKLVDTV